MPRNVEVKARIESIAKVEDLRHFLDLAVVLSPDESIEEGVAKVSRVMELLEVQQSQLMEQR